MANAKALEKKKAFVADLAEKLKNSCVGVFVDYKGINAVDDTALRSNLRKSSSDYFVVKNTLLSRATDLAGLDGLDDVFKGATAVAISKDDYSSAAKILKKFSKDNDYFTIKAGFIEGKAVSTAEIEKLAELPSKEVLITNLLRAVNSPVSGLANVLSGVIRSFAIVLNAVGKKKSA